MQRLNMNFGRIVCAFVWTALSALVVASCGGDSGTSGPTGGNITLDAAHASSDSIGLAGGTVVATSASGITYTLTIPAGALLVPTKITLTPISDQKNLPVSGSFAGGAIFEPSGLHFARAVRLSASPLPSAPAGQQLVALAFEAHGDSLGLTVLANGANSATALFTHFSGGSFVFGTTADVALLAQQTATGSLNQTFLNQLAALGAPTPPGNPAALPIIRNWFTTVVLSELQGASTDAELTLALGDYELWHDVSATYLTGVVPVQPLFPAPDLAVSGLSAQEGQASTAVAAALRAAIAGNNSVCGTQHNLQALLNVLYWQQFATHFGVATVGEQLDSRTVLAQICGGVVASSDTLSDPLQAGFPHTLVVGFTVEIGAVPLSTASTFSVTVSASGATIQNPSGLTDANGFWGGSVVTTQGDASVLITATACLLYPGTSISTGVCGVDAITRGSRDLTGLWTGIFSLSELGDVPLELHLTQHQNGVGGSYSVPIPNGPFGSVSGTLVGDTIFNFTLDEASPCARRDLVGTALIVNGELRIPHMLGSDCQTSGSLGSLDAGRTTGTPVHGVFVGTGQCQNALGCPDPNGPYTYALLVLQLADTLFIENGTAVVTAQGGTGPFRALLTGGAYSGNFGNDVCVTVPPRASCAIAANDTAPTSGTISGTSMVGSYHDTRTGFSESYNLVKQQ